MSPRFSARHTLALILAGALAGCADDTINAPVESPDLAQPAFTTGAVPNYFIFATRLTGLPRATAVASALPASGEACYNMQHSTGEWQITLTARQRAAIASALAVGATATLIWGSNAFFHFGGFKRVTVWETVTDSNGNILYENDADHHTPDGGDPAGGTFDGQIDLGTAQTNLLLAGGSIHARIKGAAEARVDDRDCGVVVAGAMAMWRIAVEPAVHVH